jgi:hypothetical protein
LWNDCVCWFLQFMPNLMSATSRGIPMTSLTEFPSCHWRTLCLQICKHPNASVCLSLRFGFHFTHPQYSQRDLNWRGNFRFRDFDPFFFQCQSFLHTISEGLIGRSWSPWFDSLIWVKCSIDPIDHILTGNGKQERVSRDFSVPTVAHVRGFGCLVFGCFI